ncbi:hypothetical protein HYALB_00009269 [Hymenoscyphus albidus]|uniref:2EXR domain-containing protein n=1 Tax=Hymenoscyphus albidus TaxID=595503 RepID=A0A9N9Q6N8_9HELO|nr:hypothetical protein HYALB_00009269 [Hymenoscyphus albidus]
MADDEGIAQLDAVQPAQDLVRLPGSVKDLETEISRLRRENQYLRNQVVILRAEALALDTGTRFPRFSSLPVEIRRMIWIYACKVPQVQIIAYKRTSSSRLNDLFDSCEEAKQVTLSLRLISFQSIGPMERINFFNPHLDTLYIKDGYTPEAVDWYRGLCYPSYGGRPQINKHGQGVSSRDNPGPGSHGWWWYQEDSRSSPPDIIHSLAIPYEDMCLEPAYTSIFHQHSYGVCIFSLFSQYQFKELLVVIKTIKIRESSERGVSFVQPTQTPHEWFGEQMEECYPEGNNFPDFMLYLGSFRESWLSLELELRHSLIKFDLHRGSSNWVPPKVKFVVAMMNEDLLV